MRTRLAALYVCGALDKYGRPSDPLRLGSHLPSPLATSCRGGHRSLALHRPGPLKSLALSWAAAVRRGGILDPHSPLSLTLFRALSLTLFARTSPAASSQCAGWRYSLSLSAEKSVFSPHSPQHRPMAGELILTARSALSDPESSFLVRRRWHKLRCGHVLLGAGAGSAPPVVAAPSLGGGTGPHRLVCSTVCRQKSACPRYSSTYSWVRFILVANVISWRSSKIAMAEAAATPEGSGPSCYVFRD